MGDIISSKTSDFLTSRDVGIALLNNTSDAVNTTSSLANATQLKLTSVSFSNQNQWSRQIFLGKDTPSVIDTGRYASSLSFSNILSTMPDSNGSTSFMNSTRFYIKIGDDKWAYVQGFTLSIQQGVQQIPELGSTTIHTIPLPGAYSYRFNLNRLIPLLDNKMDTMVSKLGTSGEPFLSQNEAEILKGDGVNNGAVLNNMIASLTNAKNLDLVAVYSVDNTLHTETYTLDSTIIDAQSISVSGGQMAIEGVSLEASSIEISNLDAQSPKSNSILRLASTAVDASDEDHCLPLDYPVRYGNSKFATAVIFNTSKTSALGANPNPQDTYILYKDCYIPSYTLSVSAGTPEITESFSMVVGKSIQNVIPKTE
jgi:hypothetical protein